jgi:class 3 adenylate cyclase
MLTQLRKNLEHAEGRSEFVISVICDIRGFSSFSARHESPDTAMFIKRFYLKLLNEYFTGAAFAKPTGDGLLLVFRYSEHDLNQVSESVLTTCFKVIDEFPTMFKDDPMINFPTPSSVGFGISRGPSCCLFSRNTILDYSGQLLNLAARLNDLARPKGIVIAGSYLQNVIPAALRNRFKSGQVYIRDIAEDNPDRKSVV